jgi:glucokinase
MQKLAIGVDVGGTHMLAVLADADGHVLHRVREHLEASERSNTEGIIQKIVQTIVQAIGACDETSSELVGLGLGIPGNVDPKKGTTRYLPNFGWLEEVLLADKILRALATDPTVADSEAGKQLLENLQTSSRRIEMRNDGRCAALAERHFGIGKDSKSKVFAMLTLGTGIGGAVCIGERGTLFDGCSFDAGDFGHHVICSGAEAFECVCGKRGCFETHASAAGLARHYRRELIRASRSDEAEEVSLDDARTVVELMRSGDEVAGKAWKLFQEDLSTGLANLISFYNPDVICLGGGISQAKELYEFPEGQSIGDTVDAKTLPATRGKCKICPSVLGDDMVAMGAAQLCFTASR